VATKKKYQDFESALEKLEEITTLLESGETSLEESMSLYTQGVEIARFCNEKLAEAEKKIKIIREQDGVLSEQKFEEDKAEK
jgi:exodeoxyribonuclease VII small subunit